MSLVQPQPGQSIVQQQLLPGYVFEFWDGRQRVVVMAENQQAAVKELNAILDKATAKRFKFDRCICAKVYPFAVGAKL